MVTSFLLQRIKEGKDAGKYQLTIDGEAFPLALELDTAVEIMDKYDLQPEDIEKTSHFCKGACPGRNGYCHIYCKTYKTMQKQNEMQKAEDHGAWVMRRYVQETRFKKFKKARGLTPNARNCSRF